MLARKREKELSWFRKKYVDPEAQTMDTDRIATYIDSESQWETPMTTPRRTPCKIL